MFQFENISALYFLIIVLIMLGVYLFSWKRLQSRWKKFGDLPLVSQLVNGYSAQRQHIKFAMMALIVVLLCISWTNPQWGYRSQTITAKSSEVFIALDISNSMLAEDISPSRLERAKRFCQKLIQELKGDKVGLILFAGQAYLQVPITHDIASVELFVRSANPQQAAVQGTNISEAINFALDAYSEEDQLKRALILITDGEDHDPQAIETARLANEKGVIVHSIGVGSSEGGFIPIVENRKQGYKKDEYGAPVKSKLNPLLIKDLASAGGGKSYLIKDDDEVISNIMDSIDKMEKREAESQLFSEKRSYFQYFLGFAILLLLLEYLLADRVSGSGLKKWIG